MTTSPALAHDLPQLHVFDAAPLRQLRRQTAISITELGARVCRSAFSIRQYEAGRADPPSNVLAAMAFVLGAEVGDLFRPATPADADLVVTSVVTPRRGLKD
jgi:hypothetical protein